MQEIWRDIKNYEGLYQISSLGNVKSLRNNKILKPGIRNEYYIVSLCKGGKQKSKTIHRLVAKTFIPNPKNKEQVNHIDGNKLNNRIENLEWCTNQENIIHSWKNGLSKVTQKMRNHNADKEKIVYQYDLDMNFIKEWKSATEAGRKLKIFQQAIVACLKGRTKTAGKYIWKYKEV